MADCPDMACFTAANAREMAARSHEARRERSLMAENDPATTANLPDYVAQRLVRVRKQLDRLDRLIMSVDPVRLCDGFAARRLGSAITKRSGVSNEIEPVILVGY